MITIIQALLVIVAAIVIFYLVRLYRKSEKVDAVDIPDATTARSILESHVEFYHKLNDGEKGTFTKRVLYFLNHIKIIAVQNAAVTVTDRVLVASAGVIPLFRFKNWFYNNLDEVLIYPSTFSKEFELQGKDRNVAGMVGDGAMHRTMILSLPYLRAGFAYDTPNNTAIHEFVHLVDKSDGATDGVPQALMTKNCIQPWLNLMREYIDEIRNHEVNDINPYGATSETEFFAVVSEYFFQKPEELEARHPELYAILEKAFEEPKE